MWGCFPKDTHYMQGASMKFIAIFAMMLAGCASVQQTLATSMNMLLPGLRVTPEIVQSFCTSQAEYDTELANARTRMKAGESHRIVVGMTACRVLATIGVPNEQQTVQVSSAPPSAHWTYFERDARTNKDVVHLVIVDPGPNQKGVVTSVVW